MCEHLLQWVKQFLRCTEHWLAIRLHHRHVLDEAKASRGPEHSQHLRYCSLDGGHAAEGERAHDRVEARIGEAPQRSGVAALKTEGVASPGRPRACIAQRPRVWPLHVHRDDLRSRLEPATRWTHEMRRDPI